MALRGLKVVELAGLAPAPFCGMVLADFGAHVIRIDKIGYQSSMDSLGNGKKSVSLNLKTSEGVNILKKICLKSDVVIEPFRKGVMERLGLGPEALLKANPKLIYARLTGYGQSGPYCANAGHDINYVGLSGLLSVFGRHNDKPTFPANLAADFGGGGLMCAFGILLALHERHSSGLGQVIDSSMVEGAAYLGSWIFRSQKLPIWGQPRGKNFLDSGAHFYDVYETKDGGYMTVGAIEPHFYANLLEVLGLDEGDVPQFVEFERGKEVFRRKFLEKTRDEWCELFDHVDACVAPLVTLDEAPLHPHNKQRGSFFRSEDGVVPKPAPVLGRTPGESSGARAAPQVGEHTRAVLRDVGYSKEEIKGFVAKGAVECLHNSKL